MQHIDVYETTRVLRRWILSCTTYTQLRTCENLIDRYMLNRPRTEAFDLCLRILEQSLRLKQIETQLKNQNTK